MGNRILAIDTATTACSVALFENDILIANNFEEIGRGHAEKLIPMIANLPDRGKADYILVNCGPGSFTGIRIGISAANALALAWGAELKGYQCLHLIAAQASEKLAGKQPVYVVMNGGHGEYFVQNFGPDATPQDDLLSLDPEKTHNNSQSQVWAGSGAQVVADADEAITCLSMLPDASKSLFLKNHFAGMAVKPVYGRSPDAKPSTLVSA